MKESVVLPEPEPIEEVVSGELEKLGIEEILALKRSDLGKLSPGQLEEIYKQAKEEILRLSPETDLPESLDAEFQKTISRNERLQRLAQKGKGFFETFSINFLLGKINVLDGLVQERSKKEEKVREAREVGESRLQLDKAVEAERAKMLVEWEKRSHQPVYSERDRVSLLRAEKGMKEKEERETMSEEDLREKKDWDKQVKKHEGLLAMVLEESGIFGPDSKIFPTDKFDDYFNGADFVVQLKPGLILLVDVTHDQKKIAGKLYRNLTRPLRKVSYPADESLKEVPGVPVVLGLSFERAEEEIREFIKRKIKGQEPECPDWLRLLISYLKDQIFLQQEYYSHPALKKHFQENKLDLAAANRAYSEVIRGLEKLKAPPKSDAPVHDRWVRILSDPLKEVAQKHPEVSSQLH